MLASVSNRIGISNLIGLSVECNKDEEANVYSITRVWVNGREFQPIEYTELRNNYYTIQGKIDRNLSPFIKAHHPPTQLNHPTWLIRNKLEMRCVCKRCAVWVFPGTKTSRKAVEYSLPSRLWIQSLFGYWVQLMCYTHYSINTF